MLIPSGSFLVDTNISLRLNDPASLQHNEARSAIAALMTANRTLYTSPQNLIEFWSVATRSGASQVNGLGLSLTDAEARLQILKTQFSLLPEIPAIYPEWERLVKAGQVTGQRTHDTRLVAFMAVHSIPNILTFNVRDFKRFEPIAGITVVDPASI